MAESANETTPNQLFSMEQMEQMFQMFQKFNKLTNPTENLSTIQLSEKLNYHNYTKWCRLMHIAINSRERLKHITVEPPSSTDSEYPKWAQRDSMVISWIIDNIDADIVNQFIDYTTAGDLWQGIKNLLSSGQDELQIYDLSFKAATWKQGNDTIESRGVQNIRFEKSDPENSVFDFLNRVNYPVYQIRIIRVGYLVLKPGIRVEYGSRILENRVPGIRFVIFFIFYFFFFKNCSKK